jgi:hypothetical protein
LQQQQSLLLQQHAMPEAAQLRCYQVGCFGIAELVQQQQLLLGCMLLPAEAGMVLTGKCLGGD